MSSQNKTVTKPPITQNGCKTIKAIFSKYDNIDMAILDKIMPMIFAGIDENTIMKKVNITKNKLYRYVCYWMVKEDRNICITVSARKYGKNNYNKYNEKLKNIIWGLENCYNITSLCDDVKIAHQTMIKYLYRLMYEARKQIFS